MNLFGARSASPAEQLGRLRDQAGTLFKDRVEPAVSDAASKASKAQPFRQVLDLLPLVAEHGGPVLQAIRRARGDAGKALAPALSRRPARHWSAPLRPVAVAALVLGVGYVAYRLSASRQPAAPRPAARRSRPGRSVV